MHVIQGGAGGGGSYPGHDLDAEAAVIACAFIRMEVPPIVRDLPPASFYAERHQRIWKTTLDLDREGEVISPASVASRLRVEGRLDQVGGSGYLIDVMNAAPVIEDRALQGYADTVRRWAAIRVGWREAQRVSALAQAPNASATEIADALVSAGERVRSGVTRAEIPSPSRILETMAVGAVRLRTMVPTLDAKTRGGIPAEKLVVLQGSPGAGKTGLAMQLALTAIAQGFAVAVLAADEEDSGLVVRMAQMMGFARDELEGADYVATRAAAADRMRALPLSVVDADRYDATVESVSAALVTMRGPRPSVLVVDSVQTARAHGTDDAEGPRLRVDAVLRALKRETKRHGHLTIALSEVSRGRYRSRVKGDRVAALAGGKESGGIEYGCGVLLDLSSVPDETGLVDVEIAKNRLGPKDLTFRLRQDFARCSFVEVDRPADADVDDGAPTRRGPAIEDDARAVVEAMLGCTGPIAGVRGLRALVHARGLRISHARLDAVVAHLGVAEGEGALGRILSSGSYHRPAWTLRRASADASN